MSLAAKLGQIGLIAVFSGAILGGLVYAGVYQFMAWGSGTDIIKLADGTLITLMSMVLWGIAVGAIAGPVVAIPVAICD